MLTTNELFNDIEDVMCIARDMANGMRQWQHDETIETTLRREIPGAEEALAALRQRFAEMQAAIDEWDRMAMDKTSTMDEAVMACEALTAFTTRIQNNGE